MGDKENNLNSKENKKIYKTIDYSGFFERLFARVIDFAIAAFIGYLVYRKFGLEKAAIVFVVFDLVMRIAMTYLIGATFGKFIFGVKVISRCSAKMSILQVILREIFKIVSAIFIYLGYITVLFNRRKRAWHDIIACTAVISGGREEAKYAASIYTKKPEKWNKIFSIIVSLFMIIFILFSVDKAASYMLYDKEGMFGLELYNIYSNDSFVYKLPDPSLGQISMNKHIYQIGDTNADGKYEIFREGIKDDKPYIGNIKFGMSDTYNGNINIEFGKNILQYRLVDLNGDKKDELAVLFEDKTVIIYKMDGEISTIVQTEPLDINEIDCFIKGKVEGGAYKLYIEGDNSLYTLSLEENNIDVKKYSLGSFDFTSFETANIDGKSYVIAITSDSRLLLYSFDGSKYNLSKEIKLPIKGKMSLLIRDIDNNNINDIIIHTEADNNSKYSSNIAYDISGDKLKLIWDGGKAFKYKNEAYQLAIDEILDVDRNKEMDVFALSKEIDGQYVKYKVAIFETSKIFLKINKLLSILNII